MRYCLTGFDSIQGYNRPMKNISPRKRFGQNFLQDERIIQRIVSAIHPMPNETVVEIGPGLGALTFPLLQAAGKLQVVELDRDLIPGLRDKSKTLGGLTIHEADALKFDFHLCGQDLHLVGNLPYNISTPLLFHLFEQIDCISKMHFMLQKEVVDRMAAKPGCKDYGRLSVMVQYYCQVESLFDVPPESFYPAPKVNSSIVQLIPYKVLPYPVENKKLFDEIVREAFNQRRKTLRNSLKAYFNDEQFAAAGVNPDLRAENLSVQDYAKLVAEA
jgi:16S rRNA (adenine1518-N6/adenine1519-N6)-dimethyltransferase